MTFTGQYSRIPIEHPSEAISVGLSPDDRLPIMPMEVPTDASELALLDNGREAIWTLGDRHIVKKLPGFYSPSTQVSSAVSDLKRVQDSIRLISEFLGPHFPKTSAFIYNGQERPRQTQAAETCVYILQEKVHGERLADYKLPWEDSVTAGVDSILEKSLTMWEKTYLTKGEDHSLPRGIRIFPGGKVIYKPCIRGEGLIPDITTRNIVAGTIGNSTEVKPYYIDVGLMLLTTYEMLNKDSRQNNGLRNMYGDAFYEMDNFHTLQKKLAAAIINTRV